jgi:hypothetical protein
VGVALLLPRWKGSWPAWGLPHVGAILPPHRRVIHRLGRFFVGKIVVLRLAKSGDFCTSAACGELTCSFYNSTIFCCVAQVFAKIEIGGDGGALPSPLRPCREGVLARKRAPFRRQAAYRPKPRLHHLWERGRGRGCPQRQPVLTNALIGSPPAPAPPACGRGEILAIAAISQPAHHKIHPKPKPIHAK